jgi:carbon-monoxide dehydrogenase large subunit
VVASYAHGTGHLPLWLSTQAPHLERSAVVDVLGLPENKVRVITGDVGGGFGCKIDTYPETILAAHLSRHLERGLEATAYWEPLAYTYPCSASVAVVELDQETGEVQLTKYIYVDDCGTVINPLIVEGQVHGGLAQGIGAALLEEAVWDDRGQLVTGSFMDYALPSAAALPRFILDRVVPPSPHNPLGAKGMGESPTIAAPPAIVNAVVDALAHLGVTHVDIPIKAEKVWRLLRDKGVAT